MHELSGRPAARWAWALAAFVLLLAGCAHARAPGPGDAGRLDVLAVEVFLADIASNVGGDRIRVAALLPEGADPHGYEPTPSDVRRVADCQVLIVNGGGLEGFLERLLAGAGGQKAVIVASDGLQSRTVEQGHEGDPGHTGDPHFWLDPNLVLTYVENIRAGLSAVDPDGSADYAVNAQAYGAELTALDAWIRDRVQTIPEARRLLVTNHESLGYYADRYGLRVVGTIIPSVSSGASPSAQQMVELVEKIRATGAPAVFLESGSNPRLADQLSSEAGILVVPGLYTHSPGSAGAGAGSYIGMMRANTLTIVEALQ